MSSPSASTAIGTTATADPASPRRGRFAPSPTGALHFGSLVAALGSCLEARATGAQWLIRVEDLDPPREQPGAAAQILRCLESYGFEWDGPVMFQSTRLEAYRQALSELERLGVIYPCTCSRRQLREQEGVQNAPVYPGTCRNRRRIATAAALRVRTTPESIAFSDGVYGRYVQQLERDVGDFIVRRRDGCFAYQLAVVVDDHAQGITDIVRGADLLDNTPRQLYLQRLLSLPTPRYTHLPLVLTAAGEKLSKQTGATPLDAERPVERLWEALRFLGQAPPPALRDADLAGWWQWAIRHWRTERVPRARGPFSAPRPAE